MPASATEVVKRWGECLDKVRGGESVTITSHGRPIARLLPPPREATAAELEAQLASLPHRESVAAAVEAARAVLSDHDLAIDRPFLMRAASALATGAYRIGSRSFPGKRKAAAPDSGAAA